MKRVWLLLLFLMLLVPQFCLSDGINFDNFSEGDFITTQIPGLTFSNTEVLTAGSNLNDFEFPPSSGTNVAFDSGGPIEILFGDSIIDFAARFTYVAPLTLQAFDAANNLVGTISSAFNTNIALSGDPGSSPNELLAVTFAGGFSRVHIEADPSGGSFTMDDISFTTSGGTPAPVPEPSTLLTMATGIVLVFFFQRRWAVRKGA